MGSTDTFTDGGARVVPSPAAAARPFRCHGPVAGAPAAAQVRGSGLLPAGPVRPATPVVRPWDLPLPGSGGTAVLQHATDSTGVPAFPGGYAERITGTTPGALPPRDPLS